MIKRFLPSRFVLLLALLLSGVMVFSSCEPLRKKFTRQKKKGQMEDKGFIPVLSPEEYPAPENNPKENYKGHYALIKVWYRDLWLSVEDKSTDKQTRYTLNQIKGHIEEMRKLLTEEKRVELNKMADLLKYFEVSLDSPLPLRNKSRIQSDLRAFDRALRKLRPEQLEASFVQTEK